MLDLLVQWVFKVVNKIVSSIFNPMVSAVTVLFPSTSTIFSYLTQYFTYAFTYVFNITQILCIPTTALTILFTYFEAKYTIHLIVLGIKGTINLYNYLKP